VQQIRPEYAQQLQEAPERISGKSSSDSVPG
jgi:hypothetical protein